MVDASAEWAFAFGVLGNIISFGVFLSPLPTFYQIYKKKSTEGFQSVPYVVALFSAMLWIYYAFLKTNTTLLVTINSFGCFIETIYICFYIFYATEKARIETVKLLVLLIACGFGLIALLTQVLVKGLTRTHIVGWICLVFSLCVFVAPMCIVRQVIQTKSVKYMPFSLSAFLTLNAVVWFFYGLLIKDSNVAIPNVLGFIFGVLQMVLYQMYRKPDKDIKDQRLPEVLEDKIVIVDEHNLSEKAEKIIDISKLSSFEIIPVVLRGVDDALEVTPKEENMQMQSQI